MEKLKEGYYYHIYNRGAGKSDIFRGKDDFSRFIETYKYYLLIAAETYAYCLLRNHFHLLIRVRDSEEQESAFLSLKRESEERSFFGSDYEKWKYYSISVQLRHLINSYTKYFNKKYSRSGTLLEGTFKRKRIIDEKHLNHLVCYIHRNPIHHKIVRSYEDYPYSSYQTYLSEASSFIHRSKALTNFGGEDNFVKTHMEFKEALGPEFYLE